jgi:hypothetical protein
MLELKFWNLENCRNHNLTFSKTIIRSLLKQIQNEHGIDVGDSTISHVHPELRFSLSRRKLYIR